MGQDRKTRRQYRHPVVTRVPAPPTPAPKAEPSGWQKIPTKAGMRVTAVMMNEPRKAMNERREFAGGYAATPLTILIAGQRVRNVRAVINEVLYGRWIRTTGYSGSRSHTGYVIQTSPLPAIRYWSSKTVYQEVWGEFASEQPHDKNTRATCRCTYEPLNELRMMIDALDTIGFSPTANNSNFLMSSKVRSRKAPSSDVEFSLEDLSDMPWSTAWLFSPTSWAAWYSAARQTWTQYVDDTHEYRNARQQQVLRVANLRAFTIPVKLISVSLGLVLTSAESVNRLGPDYKPIQRSTAVMIRAGNGPVQDGSFESVRQWGDGGCAVPVYVGDLYYAYDGTYFDWSKNTSLCCVARFDKEFAANVRIGIVMAPDSSTDDATNATSHAPLSGYGYVNESEFVGHEYMDGKGELYGSPAPTLVIEPHFEFHR